MSPTMKWGERGCFSKVSHHITKHEVVFPLKPCDENLKKVLDISARMIELAFKGDAEREDTGCGILYGIMLDSAYKIQKLAEKEKEAHIRKGWWEEEE